MLRNCCAWRQHQHPFTYLFRMKETYGKVRICLFSVIFLTNMILTDMSIQSECFPALSFLTLRCTDPFARTASIGTLIPSSREPLISAMRTRPAMGILANNPTEAVNFSGSIEPTSYKESPDQAGWLVPQCILLTSKMMKKARETWYCLDPELLPSAPSSESLGG